MQTLFTYFIFSGKMMISINKELADLYEQNVAPFNAKRAEYLAVSGGLDENSDRSSVEKEIEKGILEEVNIYRNKEEILQKTLEEGII